MATLTTLPDAVSQLVSDGDSVALEDEAARSHPPEIGEPARRAIDADKPSLACREPLERLGPAALGVPEVVEQRQVVGRRLAPERCDSIEPFL